MVRSSLRNGVVILGHWLPAPVVWLAGATAALSILGALAPALYQLGALTPAAVWTGQAWRLLTWVLFESEPISLIFGCWLIAALGPDLCQVWGNRRFLALYLSCAAVAGGLTCGLAWLLPGLAGIPYASSWVIVDALIIAWATFFPSRRILVFLVIPAQGRVLIWATVGITVLFAVYQGWPLFVPHFIAQALAGLYLGRGRFLRQAWLRVRFAFYERELRRRSARFRVVPREDKPPRYH